MTEGLRPMVPIPISAAKMIADAYGYDQVIVIARRVGKAPAPSGEHCTTYGQTPDHCAAAAQIGNHLKHRVMGWPDEIDEENLDRLTAILERERVGATSFRALALRLSKALGIVAVPARNA